MGKIRIYIRHIIILPQPSKTYVNECMISKSALLYARQYWITNEFDFKVFEKYYQKVKPENNVHVCFSLIYLLTN